MTSTVRDQLRPIFQTLFDQPDLELTDTLTASNVPGWDSFQHVTLMVAVETEFGIRFSNAEIADLQNVGELIELIEEKLAA